MDENPIIENVNQNPIQPTPLKKPFWDRILSSRSKTFGILTILIIMAAVPLTVIISRQQTNTKQSADAGSAVRYEQTDSHINKTGTWETFTKTDASGGSYGRSSSLGSTATISFIGTRLDVIAMKGTTTGKMDIYLDNNFQTTIDTAATTATYKLPLYSTGNIAQGSHTMKIVRNSSNAAGKFLTLDAVDIWGIITTPPTNTTPTPTAVPYDSNHPTVVLDPGHSPSACQEVKDGLVNPGASGEMALNWNISNLLKAKLETMGYKVVMTKQSLNDCVSNKRRAEIASENNAALYYRVHMNSGSDCHYFMITPNTTSPHTNLPTLDSRNKGWTAARSIVSALDTANVGITHRGTRESDYLWDDSRAALSGDDPKCPNLLAGSCYSRVPVTLIELAGSTCSWLSSTANLDKAAAGMATGIRNFIPISNTTTPTPTQAPTPTPTYAPTPTPMNTPTPVANTPTPTPTDVPLNTPTPSITLAPNASLLSFSVGLDGIGAAGDHQQQCSGLSNCSSNKNPNHNDEFFTIFVINENKQNVLNSNQTAVLIYDENSGLFKTDVHLNQLGNNVPPGNYTIKIKPSGFLAKTLANIYDLKYGINQIPFANLTNGDIDNDNQLTVLDYNILLSCSIYNTDQKTLCNKEPSSIYSGGVSFSLLSDLNRDGAVNELDYNLFMREFSVQSGD